MGNTLKKQQEDRDRTAGGFMNKIRNNPVLGDADKELLILQIEQKVDELESAFPDDFVTQKNELKKFLNTEIASQIEFLSQTAAPSSEEPPTDFIGTFLLKCKQKEDGNLVCSRVETD